MLDPRAEYLRTLRQTVLQESDPAVADAVRDEIEAHLDAAIQARLEIGASYEEAVQDSIASLGPLRSFAGGISEVHTPEALHAERRMFQAAWGIAGVVMSFLLTLPINFGFALTNATYLNLYVSLLLGGLALVVAFSFLSRRFAFRRLACIGAVTGLGIWVTLSTIWLDLTPEGGLGVMTRGEAASILRSYASRNADLERDIANLASIIQTRKAKGDKVAHLDRHREGLRDKLDHNREQIRLVGAAAGRSVVERAAASFGYAVLTGTATGLGLLYFHGMGVLIGRRWRCRSRRKVHA